MDAAEELKSGRMILIYDGDEREGEADLIIGAKYASPEVIERLRKDAGGLICAAINLDDAKKAGLPFFTDMLEKLELKRISCKQTAYGDKPAFSLPVNHCNVYTGITDNDRSLTMRKIDESCERGMEGFNEEFYSPGHVFLLIGRGLENRKGHTELALEMGRRAGLKVMVLCEMLGSGKALSKGQAREYAKKNNLVFIEGKDITGGFQKPPRKT